jgi:hypothetical protein
MHRKKPREGKMNIVQLLDHRSRRRVGLVDGDRIILLARVDRTTELANLAIKSGKKLLVMAKSLASTKWDRYAEAIKEKRLLPPIDHRDPAHCLITGTGLTHLGSASARDAMHTKLKASELTDSLKMFKMGLEGGKPERGKAGVQPEWFYKGDGSWLVPPGGDLPRPAFALDGGEEPEIAGLYIIDPNGNPRRLGFALGNEYSDHVTERQNYLYLAHSKLRHCAIGPEMATGALPEHIEGTSRILRDGNAIWQKSFLTGEGNMSHAIANLEHHHFKYDGFRRPGDVHIHFFGTGTLSIADGIETQDGDVFEISAPSFGAPLRNRLKTLKAAKRLMGASTL